MTYGVTIPVDQRGEDIQFEDGFFRTVTKDGHFRVLNAPNMPRSIPDMLSLAQRLPNPILSLARAGANNVAIACFVTDLFEEAQQTLEQFRNWHIKSSILVRHLGKGNC